MESSDKLRGQLIGREKEVDTLEFCSASQENGGPWTEIGKATLAAVTGDSVEFHG